MSNTDYDVIVIGAGPAGENAADRAQASGLRAAIVESELVGGECSYWACMPSKALLRPGEAVRAAARVPGAAEAVTGEIDVAAALARRDALSSNWDDAGQVKWLEGQNIDLLRGHGRLDGERTVTVENEDGNVERYVASKAVIIATGTAAAHPPIDGLSDVDPWDNREITTAKEVPRRLLVIGGGVVGVEMAQAWKSLGSLEVTIVEMQDHLLPREEPFVGAELQKALERMDVKILTGVSLGSIRRDGTDGPLHAKLSDGSAVEADQVLVAVGRRPLTRDIGLDSVGLEPGGYLQVNDHLQVEGLDWLYAVGDVNGRALLTHAGKYQARVAGDHIAGATQHVTAWADLTAVPRVVFTDPQIAAVGLTERQAKEAGIDVQTVSYNLGHTAGAAAAGKGISGTAQLVIDTQNRVIVGATFVGPGVGEMLHAATIAIVGKVTVDELWHAMPAFPTISEVWLRLLEEFGM